MRDDILPSDEDEDDTRPNEVEETNEDDEDIFGVDMIKPVFNGRRPTKTGDSGKLSIPCLDSLGPAKSIIIFLGMKM